MNGRVTVGHGIAALILLAIGYALCYSSPFAAEYSPQLAGLRRRWHSESVARQAADSSRARTARHAASLDSAVVRLERRESTAVATARFYASRNRSMLDSLAQLNPSLAPALGRISQGVASQDSACTEASNTCAEVKDSLRLRVREADSLTTQYVDLTGRFAALSHDAIAADSSAERQAARSRKALLGTRILAAALVVLALVVK